MSENHLRTILKLWAHHYNRGRPHTSLGPGLPDPPFDPACSLRQKSRHRVGVPLRVKVKSVLGGLHNEYALQAAAQCTGRWGDALPASPLALLLPLRGTIECDFMVAPSHYSDHERRQRSLQSCLGVAPVWRCLHESERACSARRIGGL